ncbi:MAG: hypothetical protein ABMA64_23675 [Myxococcota bacterium]
MKRSVWLAAIGVAVGSAAGVAAIGAAGPHPRAVRRDADLAEIHEQLIPAWSASEGGARVAQLERLRGALIDPELEELFDRIAAPEAPAPGELRLLVDRWNDTCKRSGHRWRLSGEVSGGRVTARTYRVVDADDRVSVGGWSFPIEVRRRVDDRTPVDPWLGQVHRGSDGVVVLLDRVEAFTDDTVRPLLDPASDPARGPLERAFAPTVRAQAAAAVGPEPGALVEWVARSIVVHEGRHGYDRATLGGQRIPCRGCPSDTTHVGALEGVAYLAGFADPSTGALAMLQACAVLREAQLVPDRASMIRFLTGELAQGGCDAGPPPDLAARATALSERTFGSAVEVSLPEPGWITEGEP